MHSAASRFREEALLLPQHFPGLRYGETADGQPYVAGTLELLDEEGGFVDAYQIRVEPSTSYPFSFPRIYETGGRIPVNVDWHVFPDGHCCLKSLPEEVLRCKGGIGLQAFLETEVKPYFFNQKFRELHGYFLNERAHGVRGNVAFFEELFGTSDPVPIAQGLLFVQQRTEPNRVNRCFCGSGQKYRKCHRKAYRLLRQFSNEELDLFLRMLASISAEVFFTLTAAKRIKPATATRTAALQPGPSGSIPPLIRSRFGCVFCTGLNTEHKGLFNLAAPPKLSSNR